MCIEAKQALAIRRVRSKRTNCAILVDKKVEAAKKGTSQHSLNGRLKNPLCFAPGEECVQEGSVGVRWSRCSRLRNCRFMGAHIYLSLSSVPTHSLHQYIDMDSDQKFTPLHIVLHI